MGADKNLVRLIPALLACVQSTQVGGVTVLVGLWLGATAATAEAAAPDFESQVAPLLIQRCVECHQGADPSGGLQLTTREGLIAGGDSGAAIDLKDVNSSYLLQRIVENEMPPAKQGRSQKLPDEEVQLIRDWLKSGAAWPKKRQLDFFERTNAVRAGRDWWSLQPVVRPAVPKLKTGPQPAHPIDAFVRARLERSSASPAPEADRRTLIRRAYYVLLGLPPTEAEIKAFVDDPSQNAWGKLVDRLLDSPHYGERWARHWLDLVRYADTSGYERDQEKPFAWRYRDWVVQALNDDMPYDRFIVEQLAGDEIENRTRQSVIATGFLRLGAWNDEPNDPADYQYERLEDLVHTTSSAFLGLTVKCARCHSHKFDAIKQEDYYRVASAFWPGPVRAGRGRNLLGGPSADELGEKEVLGWTDLTANPPPLHVLKNGERHQPLEAVIPTSLSSIPSLERRFDKPQDGAKTSQRRLQLARWIANPKNPLTSRVIVNRLWQHHFGRAIVRTPNNFGFLADPPTHPQLLDWLTAEFTAGGRRLKKIHRLILTSATWKQSSLHPEATRLRQIDSGNRLWWRAERRRLDAETLRDSLLAASGDLDLTVGGPGFKPTISPQALEGLSRKSSAWQASDEKSQHRRSLYMYLKRGLLPPLMTTFDLSDATQSCGQRDVTIVPTQALALLNNEFVHQRSTRLAARIQDKAKGLESQVGEVWLRVLKRRPSTAEMSRSIRHIERQSQAFSKRASTEVRRRGPDPVSLKDSLAFHMTAGDAVVGGDDRVAEVRDASGRKHHATQPVASARPVLTAKGIGGKPTLEFDGQGRYLQLAGQLLKTPQCTIVCVARDDGEAGHRELISNWNGAAGNSTASVFLGLTQKRMVRFSDAFLTPAEGFDPSQPFVLSAVNGANQASVFENGRPIKVSSALPGRRLDTAWVVGQQGSINGEYWKGGIAEIRVYDRALSQEERQSVERELAERYGLTIAEGEENQRLRPATLALASLCHALMNSNEFLFVD